MQLTFSCFEGEAEPERDGERDPLSPFDEADDDDDDDDDDEAEEDDEDEDERRRRREDSCIVMMAVNLISTGQHGETGSSSIGLGPRPMGA